MRIGAEQTYLWLRSRVVVDGRRRLAGMFPGRLLLVTYERRSSGTPTEPFTRRLPPPSTRECPPVDCYCLLCALRFLSEHVVYHLCR